MKTKMMKHAAAFAASVLMTAAMAVPAAAEKTKTSGTSPAVTATPAELELTKTIKMYNTENKAIYEPNLTYNYKLSQPTVGDGVTIKGLLIGDNEKTGIVAVTSGANAEDGAVQLQYGTTKSDNIDLVFGDDSAPTTAAEVSESFKIVTNAEKFPKAGVYRYAIQQTVDKAAAGVGEDEDDVFGETGFVYLDVYVKKAEGSDTLETYGLVLFKAGEATTSFEYDGETEDGLKINALDPDEYKTVNAEVKKVIEGDMADKTHKFPFKIDVTTLNTAEYYYTENGGTAQNKLTGTQSIETSLGNEEYVTIIGLPDGYAENLATHSFVNVFEKNDTPDTYVAKYELFVGDSSITGTSQGAVPAKGTDWKNVTANTSIRNSSGSASGKDILVITNTLEAISPTGVLFRIAPYALMMTAGGVLIAVYLRGKKREDAESMI